MKPPRTSLEHRTKIDRAYWELKLYREAAEAVGAFHSAGPASRPGRGIEPTDSAEDATRRARGRVRRYCAANRLNRLGTLTYAGAGQFEPRALRVEVAGFFRRVRDRYGSPMPYLWTAEWHPGGHGLHVHFAVDRFIHREWIEADWVRGFIKMTYIGDLPVGSGTLGEARAAARYLAKYVSKDLDAGRSFGLHRYDVARGFQPRWLTLTGVTAQDVLDQAGAVMGRAPAREWRSSDEERWQRPPAVWAQWNG